MTIYAIQGGQDLKSKNIGSLITDVCTQLNELLLQKNKAYGESAFKPLGIFSGLSTKERLNVRIDDKLARIKCGEKYKTEDEELDLIGYLILKRVWRLANEDKGEFKPARDTGSVEWVPGDVRDWEGDKLLEKQCSCADCTRERLGVYGFHEETESVYVDKGGKRIKPPPKPQVLCDADRKRWIERD